MPRTAKEYSNWLYQVFARKVSAIRIPFIFVRILIIIQPMIIPHFVVGAAERH
jgi:hypothetical protein